MRRQVLIGIAIAAVLIGLVEALLHAQEHGQQECARRGGVLHCFGTDCACFAPGVLR